MTHTANSKIAWFGKNCFLCLHFTSEIFIECPPYAWHWARAVTECTRNWPVWSRVHTWLRDLLYMSSATLPRRTQGALFLAAIKANSSNAKWVGIPLDCTANKTYQEIICLHLYATSSQIFWAQKHQQLQSVLYHVDTTELTLASLVTSCTSEKNNYHYRPKQVE